MTGLEGANCLDLPGFVVEKYFHCDVGKQPLLAHAAKAICSNCVVMEECRQQALNMAGLQTGGVIGGVTVSEIRRARSWRSYELGLTEKVPESRRPEWLGRPEATEIVEQWRLECDPDEATTV